MILFNDLHKQYQNIKAEINTAIKRVLDSGWFILGKELEAFENEFANYIGSNYCVGVASGTEAIALSLLSIDIDKGDEVITTNLTAFPTICAIYQAGAAPVVVDINNDDGLLDCNKIEEKITDKTKAIVPVHLYGQSCDMDKILDIAKRYNLKVIEDCAQSAGSTYRGRKTGTFGYCGAFSFYPTKNLGAYGDGGIIVTNHETTYKKLRSLSNYGQSKKFYHDQKGINSRLDEIQAAILRVKLKYLDEWNNKRRKIANLYQRNLRSVECLKENSYGSSNYHLFVIKSDQRNELIDYLNKNSIQTSIHYPVPVNKQKGFTNQKNEIFNVADPFVKSILSIPMYPELSQSEIDKIINVINAFKN